MTCMVIVSVVARNLLPKTVDLLVKSSSNGL